MPRKGIVLATMASLALGAPVASAHVTMQPGEAQPGEFTRIAVRVPNERGNASTTKVRVKFPPGFPFVSYEPVPGWTATVTSTKLDTPITAEGRTFTSQVDAVTFTATAGQGIAPGQFRDFPLSVRMPDEAQLLSFPAVQTYSSGEVVRWIGEPDAAAPAPQVIVAPLVHAHGAAAQPAPATTAGSAGGDGYSTLAFILGGLGFITGGVSLFWRRRGPGA